MKRKTLELCSGTMSFSRVMKERDYETITVDIDPMFGPTHLTDILAFDFKTLYPDRDTFDVIWASPPCTEYSIAKTVGKRDFETADAIVLKCLEIIEYYQPRLWFIENPYTGYLKSRPFMKGLHYDKVDYCAYEQGEGRGIKKRTAIWHTNNNGGLELAEQVGDLQRHCKPPV